MVDSDSERPWWHYLTPAKIFSKRSRSGNGSLSPAVQLKKQEDAVMELLRELYKCNGVVPNVQVQGFVTRCDSCEELRKSLAEQLLMSDKTQIDQIQDEINQLNADCAKLMEDIKNARKTALRNDIVLSLAQPQAPNPAHSSPVANNAHQANGSNSGLSATMYHSAPSVLQEGSVFGTGNTTMATMATRGSSTTNSTYASSQPVSSHQGNSSMGHPSQPQRSPPPSMNRQNSEHSSDDTSSSSLGFNPEGMSFFNFSGNGKPNVDSPTINIGGSRNSGAVKQYTVPQSYFNGQVSL